MNTPKERRWEQHMADEAAAIASQQATAGDGHSPVTGPPPHGDFNLNALARTTAEQANRRCAQLLEDLVESFLARGEQAIPVANVQALAARMRASDTESS